MQRALVYNCIHQAVANGGIVALDRGANDVSFFAVGNTTFKLQGSKDNGSTYADIAGTSMPAVDTSVGSSLLMTLVNPQVFDHLKVVIDSGNVIVVQQLQRSSPANIGGQFAPKTGDKIVIDPQLGTP